MNRLEQKDVKNSGAICDWPSHKHTSAVLDDDSGAVQGERRQDD